MSRFRNRVEAGRLLASQLTTYANNSKAIILALPRGGVPVGFEISNALNIPLDIFLIRKLGVPGQEELALGAIASGGIRIFNDYIIKNLNISEGVINSIISREQEELQRRNKLYRENRPFPNIKEQIVILVDDGLATGATMRAAITAVKQMQPAKIIVAAPVSAYDTYQEFKKIVDEVICLETPEPFYSLSLWYEDFRQTTDEEVCLLLNYATKKLAEKNILAENKKVTNHMQSIDIKIEKITLKGNLSIPTQTQGLVIFAHGSGSSRLSPRNQYVASFFNQEKLATLLFDLLTAEEEVIDTHTAQYRFDIPLLAKRLQNVTNWLLQELQFQDLSIGYFGASTGAAAALIAAAEYPDPIKAVVSRGGRPDLAGAALSRVKAPTLLIVGELDEVVIELNQKAQAAMHAPTKLEIIPGATHLFEEPGALDEVTRLACRWFKHYCEAKKIPPYLD